MLPAHIREVAEPVGVRGAVLVECSPWVEDNDWVLNLVANEPFICAVVGNLDPESADFPALLDRFARNPRFRGIRIRPGRPLDFDHPHLRPNLQAMAAMRCTLDVVMRGADLVRLAQLAAEMPGLRIMIDHLAFVKVTGSPPDPAWIANMERFSGLPSVFCKVSRFTEQAAIQPAPLEMAYYAPVFDVVWRVFGADRLAYGSNWPPCLNAGDYCATVNVAPISEPRVLMRSPRSWEAMPPPSTAARDFLRCERQATRSGQEIANVKADTGSCGTAVIHVVRLYGGHGRSWIEERGPAHTESSRSGNRLRRRNGPDGWLRDPPHGAGRPARRGRAQTGYRRSRGWTCRDRA